MTYNLDDMIKDSGTTPGKIAQGVAEMDLEAIKAKRERQAKTRAQWAREEGAKTAAEWTRTDFACFIKRAPELAQLTDNELRALFLKDRCYNPDGHNRLYVRVKNLYMWRRARKNNLPEYEIALNGLTGEEREKEWYRIHDIWRTL